MMNGEKTAIHPAALVICHFYVRAGAGPFRYEPVNLGSRDGSGYLTTPHPPAVGDLISLYDTIKKAAVNGRVIERAWHHSSYGSANWPYLESLTTVGPALDVIVVPDAGPFRDEAEPLPDEDDPE
jgi:hypothetical protein